AKALGPDVLGLPRDQAARLAALGAALSAGSLARLWQMLLKAHEEVRRAPDPAAAVDMTLIRLAYAADLPGPEEALKALRAGESTPAASRPGSTGPSNSGGGAVARAVIPRDAPRATAKAAPTLADPKSFEDVVRLIDERRDIGLKLDVERYLRPISFRTGAVVFKPAPGAPANLAQRLVARLKEWTGQPWLVAAEGGGGAETLMERGARALAAAHEDALAEPFVQAVMEAFPGTRIVDVRQMAGPDTARADPIASDED
ncbi:MAG: DNA polymerase III subunit gamma/tau, partial [Caulobacteraceae bacterium]